MNDKNTPSRVAEVRTYFVVMQLQNWTDMSLEGILAPLGKLNHGANVGQHFLPVFLSREEAEKHYPAAHVLAMESK